MDSTKIEDYTSRKEKQERKKKKENIQSQKKDEDYDDTILDAERIRRQKPAAPLQKDSAGQRLLVFFNFRAHNYICSLANN
jgi:hypothetical protein